MISKLALFLGLILSTLDGSSFIGLNTHNLNFDWVNGNNTPIFSYVTVTNKGDMSVRFDASSSSDWVNVYRESQPNVRSITISRGASVNFIVEIYPQNLGDGNFNSTINFNVVNKLDGVLLESDQVKVTLNKNYKPTSTVEPANTPDQTPSPSLSSSPAISISPLPSSVVVNPTITPTKTPSPGLYSPKPSVSPILTLQPTKSQSWVPSISSTPNALPSPTLSNQIPISSDEVKRGGFWQFVRDFFSGFNLFD